jgi:hypothetical protein
LRAPASTASIPPRTPAGARPRATGGSPSRGRIAAIVGGVVGALAVVAVAAILLFGGDDDKPAATPNTVAPPSSSVQNAGGGGGGSAKKAAPKLNRGATTVAVLNGTTFTGLARSASDKITGKGYREGAVTNDPSNQQHPVTEVFYEPNAKPAALDVAKILAVKAANVKPMDANARVLADRAQVAVFVGADKAQ